MACIVRAVPDFSPDADPAPEAEDLTLSLHNVTAAPGPTPESLAVQLQTSRGDIQGLFHPVQGGTGAVICVGGAMGGLDGPADGLYTRLPGLLNASRVSVLRLDYRHPDAFEECVLDVLAGCSFLKGIGASEAVLVGHSFGGAVVIKAGALHPLVRAVASLSPQLYGTRQVEELACPLLLVHGDADEVLDSEASEDIYRRATDPKRLVLYGDTGHALMGLGDALDTLLGPWIAARLQGEPMESGRSLEWPTGDPPRSDHSSDRGSDGDGK